MARKPLAYLHKSIYLVSPDHKRQHLAISATHIFMLHKWKNCWWMQFYEKQVVGVFLKHIWMLLSCAWKQSGVSIKKSSSLTYHLKMYQWPTISNWFWNKWANKTSKGILHSTLIWWLSLSLYIYISKWGSKKTTLCLPWMSTSSGGGREGGNRPRMTDKQQKIQQHALHNLHHI